MNKVIITKLPRPHGAITGCRYNGYVVHAWHKESSINHATIYSKEHNIRPNQKRLQRDFENFKRTLKTAWFHVIVLPFPNELNKINSLHHDAVFVRDAGLMINNYWIKGHYSVDVRQKEAEVYAPLIAKKFKKKIIELPPGAEVEFWETIYINTAKGSYYFWWLSRSNKKGHNFVRDIVKPDHYILIESQWYHLDTVFSPVINKENKLVALLVTKWMLSASSIASLKKLHAEIIFVDNIDSSWQGKELWNYAVNALTAPGIIVSSSKFKTPGVEKRLVALWVKHFVTSLNDYKYAWWSVHCLTNEIYE